jgi:hypothetical protein
MIFERTRDIQKSKGNTRPGKGLRRVTDWKNFFFFLGFKNTFLDGRICLTNNTNEETELSM